MQKITQDWLQRKAVCLEAVKYHQDVLKGETDAVKILEHLIKNKKLTWANWLIVHIMTKPQYLSYAIYSAESVIGMFEKAYPKDTRPREAIEATSTAKAAWAAWAAETAAWAAAKTAWAAGDPGEDAWAAAETAEAAWAAAGAAAEAAAWAARAAGNTTLKKILEYGMEFLKNKAPHEKK